MYDINVEEIMKGIRSEIAEKGYTEEQMSYMTALANVDVSDLEKRYNEKELDIKLEYISKHYANPVYFPLKGNPVKVFLQRAVRRVLLFVIYPAFQYQNAFNNGTEHCIQQMRNYIRQTDKTLAAQQEEIALLKQEIETLKKGKTL